MLVWFITIKDFYLFEINMINFVSHQSDQNFKVIWFQIINDFISITHSMDIKLWIIDLWVNWSLLL